MRLGWTGANRFLHICEMTFGGVNFAEEAVSPLDVDVPKEIKRGDIKYQYPGFRVSAFPRAAELNTHIAFRPLPYASFCVSYRFEVTHTIPSPICTFTFEAPTSNSGSDVSSFSRTFI